MLNAIDQLITANPKMKFVDKNKNLIISDKTNLEINLNRKKQRSLHSQRIFRGKKTDLRKLNISRYSLVRTRACDSDTFSGKKQYQRSSKGNLEYYSYG
jgi:hypothetical protein